MLVGAKRSLLDTGGPDLLMTSDYYVDFVNNRATLLGAKSDATSTLSTISTPPHVSTGKSGTLYTVPANVLDATVVPAYATLRASCASVLQPTES